MLLLLAYCLMLFDAVMTLVVHEEVGELNPLWIQALEYDSNSFIYGKIAISVALALGILSLWRLRPEAGRLATMLAILVYGSVAYVHIEVYRAITNRPPLLPQVVDAVDRLISDNAGTWSGGPRTL